MKKQLAEVVDGTEIKEIIEVIRPENEFSGSNDKNAGEPHSLSSRILYSCENNGANNLYSTKKHHTCGELRVTMSHRYKHILTEYAEILAVKSEKGNIMQS